jgi:signal transduction histidine kinase
VNRQDAAVGVIEALPHAIMVVDEARRLVHANAAFWTEAGADPRRFPAGTPWRDMARLLAFRGLLGAGDPAALAEQALAEDRARYQLRHIRSADGARLSEVSSLPLPGGGFALCSVDITALHRAEATTRNRAALLERALGSQHSGVALFDASQRLVLHNRAYRHHSGATPEMLAGNPTLPAIIEALAGSGEYLSARNGDELQAAIAADRRVTSRVHREKLDGTVVRFTSTPEPDGGFLIETDDVTDLRQAEDEARRRAAMLDGALEALPHGICVWGPDRRVSMFNTTYTRLMEGAPLQVGDTLEDVIRRRAEAGEYGRGEAEARYRQELARDVSRLQERRRVRANGTALDIRTAPLPDGGHISVVTEITALWRAEEEARRRAELLETALGAIRHGIVICGPDHRILAANLLARTLVGHAPDEPLVGRTAGEVIEQLRADGQLGAEPMASQIVRMAATLDRGRPQVYERTTPDGRVLEVASDPTPDGGFVITHTDITDLVEAKNEARRRAETLERAMASLRHGLVVYGPDRRVVVANTLAGELAGHQPGELREGALLDDLLRGLHASGGFGPEPTASELLRTGIAFDRSQTYRAVRETPAGRVLQISSDPTPDGGFIVTHIDITARARAEQDARERAAILQVMLDNMRHGIALFDASGLLLAANALAADMCGLPPELMHPGTTLAEMRQAQTERGEFSLMEADPRADSAQWNRPLTAPDRFVRRRPNGRIIEVTTDRTPDGGFVRTYTDVTDDRQVRDELERARLAAEAASEAKSRFLGTMSHELRTPLAAVIGYAEALLADPAPERVAEYAATVHDSGRQLLSLIDDILDVARAGSDRPSTSFVPVEPGALLASLATALAADPAAAGLEIAADAAPGLPLAATDERRLRRILQILIGNAVKFTPTGGSVRLEAGNDGSGDLVFRITDTGIGMAPEDIPRAFEPFTQLESSFARRYPGSGLGLHLARMLAETIGANLTLDSQQGVGTTATLRLPRAITISDPRDWSAPAAGTDRAAAAIGPVSTATQETT